LTTRARLCSPTGRLPLTTLDAVAGETPAREATSWIVGAFRDNAISWI
jgi:hypothetical protein